jgi:hypothetical protein
MASTVNLKEEASKMEKIIRRKCGRTIKLSYVDTPEAGYFLLGNHEGKEQCIKNVILQNLNTIHPIARYALVGVANNL